MTSELTILEQEGLALPSDLAGRLPSEEEKKKGPYAVIECFEEIPCNPCVISCRFNAIKAFKDINDLPFVDFSACTGCGVCARVCPGLAICIVDESMSGDRGTIQLPYEYLPLPEKGDIVMARGRKGQELFPARVLKVSEGGKTKTALVTLDVAKTYLHEVRSFTVLATETEDSSAIKTDLIDRDCESGKYDSESRVEESPIVCRCEGVSLAEIRDLIARGYKSLDEIKQISRAGMGPCQGRSCRQIILNELARDAGISLSEIAGGSFRPPATPVSLDILAKGGSTDEENS